MNELPTWTHGSSEDFEMSASIAKLMDALAKAQGAMGSPHKNKKNPHFNSWYADLSSMIECAKPHLSANGLAVTQGAGMRDDKVIITTLLGHSSGEWVKTRLYLKPDKPTPQGVGSAITYGRRFAHSAILNTAPDDDDDGNQAEPKKTPVPKTTKPAGYDPQNRSMQDWLVGQLKKHKVDEDKWDLVGNALKGRPSSDFEAVLRQVLG